MLISTASVGAGQSSPKRLSPSTKFLWGCPQREHWLCFGTSFTPKSWEFEYWANIACHDTGDHLFFWPLTLGLSNWYKPWSKAPGCSQHTVAACTQAGTFDICLWHWIQVTRQKSIFSCPAQPVCSIWPTTNTRTRWRGAGHWQYLQGTDFFSQLPPAHGGGQKRATPWRWPQKPGDLIQGYQ